MTQYTASTAPKQAKADPDFIAAFKAAWDATMPTGPFLDLGPGPEEAEEELAGSLPAPASDGDVAQSEAEEEPLAPPVTEEVEVPLILSAHYTTGPEQKESVPAASPPRQRPAPPAVAVPRELLALFRSAAELAANPPPPTEWVVGRLLPLGGLVQLTGAAKGGGKTTLLCYALGAAVKGESFLGEPTMRTPAVYLTEQARSTFESQYLVRAGLRGSLDFHVLYGHEAAGYRWEEVVAAAVATCDKVGARVLAIDTFAYWAKVEDENEAAEMQRKLRPLQDAAAAGLTVVVVHHDRKGGGEAWVAGRGSSAFAGAVDVIINARNPNGGQSSKVRELQCIGRYGELYDSLMIELTPSGYVSRGTERAVALAAAEKAVMDALPTGEADALSEASLMAAVQEAGTSTSRSTLKRVLDLGIEARTICFTGSGVKNDPRRYFLSDGGQCEADGREGEMLSVQAHGLNGQNESGAPLAGGDGVAPDPEAVTLTASLPGASPAEVPHE